MHYQITRSAILEPRHSARGSYGTTLASRPGLATLRNAAPTPSRAQAASQTARVASLVERTLANSWRTWTESAAALVRMHRFGIRMTHLALSRSWHTWARYTRERIRAWNLARRSGASWQMTTTATGWRSWREAHAEGARARALIGRAMAHLSSRTLSRGWLTWVGMYTSAARAHQKLRRGSRYLLNRHLGLDINRTIGLEKLAGYEPPPWSAVQGFDARGFPVDKADARVEGVASGKSAKVAPTPEAGAYNA